jgi:hypothetical protein
MEIKTGGRIVMAQVMKFPYLVSIDVWAAIER